MAISEAARRNHDALFPNHHSTLSVTDPELIELFDNWAFDEIIEDAPLDVRLRLMVQLAALIASPSLAEYRVMHHSSDAAPFGRLYVPRALVLKVFWKCAGVAAVVIIFSTRPANGPRFITAAIASSVVGLFNFGQGVSVSPLAIAFLAGYAVDVFFSFLETLIETLSKVRAKEPGDKAAGQG